MSEPVAASSSGLKRVALIDHWSAGGVSRFLFALITVMARMHPETTFVYFVGELNVIRDDLYSKLASYDNVLVRPIRHLPPPETEEEQIERGAFWRVSVGLLKRMPRLHRALLDAYVAFRDRNIQEPEPVHWFEYELEEDSRTELELCEVIYLGWPYFIKPFDTQVPVVATFHDFHYKYFPRDYPPDVMDVVEAQTPEWLRRCSMFITSSVFIQSDVLKFYGDVAPPHEVVYLAPYGLETPSEELIEEALERLEIRRPYVLYSGAPSPHKNVGSLIRAVGIMRDRGTPVQLIITGVGTDVLGRCSEVPESSIVYPLCAAIDEVGLRWGDDFLALGYVSNSDVDALSAAAAAVVSPSTYEAGCGPALDAWQRGVPVAFSNIPPFVEQLDHLGVEAYVFDPNDPEDIADKVREAVFDVARSREMADRSRVAIQRCTWEDTARGYYGVFQRVAGLGAGSQASDRSDG